MDGNRAGAQNQWRSLGRNLPVSIKTTLRDYISERSFEKNIVAERAEQAKLVRRQGIYPRLASSAPIHHGKPELTGA